MIIERVSKYITINHSGISSKHGDGRRVLLSMPRVKWLEAQPDYTPWPPLEEKQPKQETKINQPTRYQYRPHLRKNELSDRQRQAWTLSMENYTRRQIAEKMQCSQNAVAKLIAQAREKLLTGDD